MSVRFRVCGGGNRRAALVAVLLVPVIAVGLCVPCGGGEAGGASPAPAGTKAGPSEKAAGDSVGRFTLDDCISLAVYRNVSLRKQAVEVRDKQLAATGAKAVFLPTLSSDVIYGPERPVTNLSSLESVPGVWTSEMDYAASLSLEQGTPWGMGFSLSGMHAWGDDLTASGVAVSVSQSLLKGAGLREGLYEVRAAGIDSKTAFLAMRLGLRQTVLEVRRRYAEVEKRRIALGVTRAAVKRAERLLEGIKARWEKGLASETDIAAAEIQVARSRAREVESASAVENALDNLKHLLDIGLSERITVVPRALDVQESWAERKGGLWQKRVEVAEATSEVWMVSSFKATGQERNELARTLLFKPQKRTYGTSLARALDTDLALAVSRLKLSRATLNTRRAGAETRHKLDLTCGLSWYGSGLVSEDSLTMDDHGWWMGLNYGYRIGSVSERIELQRALLAASVAQMEVHEAEVNVLKRVRDIFRRLEALGKKVIHRAVEMHAASRLAEAANVLRERGIPGTTYWDVVLAEERVLGAQTNFTDSVIDYGIILAELDAIEGSGDESFDELLKTGRLLLNDLWKKRRRVGRPDTPVPWEVGR